MDFLYWENKINSEDTLLKLSANNQSQTNKYHFVLIHIGNDLPLYMNVCIHQIRLFNSPDSSTLWVLAKEKELGKIEDCLNLKKIPIESIPTSSKHSYFTNNYTNDNLNNFWKYTIERFFYLEEIMRLYHLENVFHLEYDMMLYINAEDYLPVFLINYKGLGITLDCDYRAVPGFMFIRDVNPLELFNQYVTDMIKQNRNDMQLLADFRSFTNNDEVIQTLPVLLPGHDKPLRNSDGYVSLHPHLYINHFEDFQGIFDAAAIGQYLGGISPRNNPQRRNTIGFINETCIFQCSSFNFTWKVNVHGLKTPFISYSGTDSWYPIFTLHIHSKNLVQFLSDQTMHEGCKTGLTGTHIDSKIETLNYFKYSQKNESIQPGVQSNLTLDILIPAVEKDLKILPLTIDSVLKNLKHPIGRIIVVAPDSEKIKAVCALKACEFMPEDAALSVSKKNIRYNVDGVDRSGWLFQQLIKLSGDTICSEEHYLAMDADTVLLRPQVFEVNGKTLLLHSDEHHQPYFDLYKGLFGAEAKTALSFVGHHMVFNKAFLREFREYIVKNSEDWLAALFKNIDFSQMSGMSEYELYGQWLLAHKSEHIVREYFYNASFGESMYMSLEELQVKFSKYYRSVSFHDFNMNMRPEISLRNATVIPQAEPLLTMSTLGKNGRFGNQIFQYAFLKIYAKEHKCHVETPEWIGQYLFGHKDPPISRTLPQVSEGTTFPLNDSDLFDTSAPFKNVDFWGYFQYHTKFYAPHKEYFRSLFKPKQEIESEMQKALQRLHAHGKTLVGVHLRRGDYSEGCEKFFIAPNEWYRKLLQEIWKTFDDPVLFISSDKPEMVRNDFKEYRPLTAKDLGVTLPKAHYYPDFYLLSKCDVVAISNSSFSFAACMLNDKCNLFFRPHMPSKKLIPFDPWNDEILYVGVDYKKTIRNLLETEQFKEAVEAIEQVIEIYPNSPYWLNLKGELMFQSGNIEEATKMFLHIKEKWPDYVDTLNNLAIILCLEKNWDGAKKILEKAFRLSQDNKSVLENLRFVRNNISISEVKQFIQKGNITDAKRVLNQILSADEKHIEALNQLALIHIESSNFDEAEKNLSLVLLIEPDNEEALMNLQYLNQRKI